jgi:uncharacterized protein (TIGR00369 family)
MKFPIRVPFVELLGFELLGIGDGQAEIAVELNEELHNSFQVAHGGLTMTLLDVAMAHAARSVHLRLGADGEMPDLGPGAVTIEMKTSFLAPGLGRLVARGRLLHRTATLAFCEGSVHAGNGRLCAHATGTFKYLRAIPTRASAPTPPPDPEGFTFGGSGSD